MGLNIRAILKVFGIMTLIEGLFMLPASAIGLFYEEWNAVGSLFTISIICISIGFVLITQLRFDKIILRTRDGYFMAFASWVYCSILGAMPLYIYGMYGMDFSFINCLFESVAGFSTTGCSVLDINTLPNCMLIWRGFCHWLGGMGILVLLISIFPLWGINNQSLAKAESPSADSVKMESKSTDMGKFLYSSYLALSVLEFILLLIGPMDWFNALLATCSSISTAGLIITPDSAWMYQTLYSRIVIMMFSILSSLNFVIYFLAARKKIKDIFKNNEIRTFFVIIGIATALVALSLRLSGTYSSIWQAVRDGLFQVVSFVTTSGYYVCDYTSWPAFTTTILIILLFIGGCSFSTSGSLKVIRVMVLFRLIRRGFLQQIHPNVVKAVMLDERTLVPARMASSIASHTILFFIIFILGCVLLSFNNFDIETTVTTSIGMFSNTGMALGIPGSSGYFGMFNQFSQIVMCFLMIAGRLEIYAMVIFFAKSFWKPDTAVHI
ncbi:MAG: hypothetical protein DBY08_01255 [Clostridiales bacterium]|nr:TrkH family potassium uptake protein [Bacillota bacterium]MEE0516974.1 potassium transporter TrkG [Anaerovoracaceae bacterium]PWL94501.1 MAG: hypothetical protein DBY08_01255 [Clostridiales bacterium]